MDRIDKQERVAGVSITASTKDLQHEGKQVDDVQVDVEGGKYVLLWTDGVTFAS